MKIKDELPTGLEFVEGSERAEGENPKPLHVKVKNGIVLAEYPEIVDTKERSIIFKVKVKEKAKVGEEIEYGGCGRYNKSTGATECHYSASI